MIGRMMMVAALALVPLGAAAGTLTDLVMAPGVMAGNAEGTVLRYAQSRRLPGLPAGAVLPGAQTGVPLPKAVVDGDLRLTFTATDTGPQIVMTLVEGGHSIPVASFSASGPNPVLIFFLENVMRNMAAQTGGSPHYMRNVIRATLAEAAPELTGGRVQTVTLRPFDGDPNAARMGDFAGLTLALTFDPAVPGRLLDMVAQAGDGPGSYRETLTLESD